MRCHDDATHTYTHKNLPLHWLDPFFFGIHISLAPWLILLLDFHPLHGQKKNKKTFFSSADPVGEILPNNS